MNDALAGLELGDELAWEPSRLAMPGAWTGHIPFAFWLIKALRPATLVELGTHSGNSYFAFCQAMAAFAPAGRAYAVDTWVGDQHAGGYGEEVFASVSGFNTEHFRRFSTLLRTTFDDARQYFPEGAVDLLHIDGMHTYDAVRHDFETWQSRLSPRAVVVFHDTNVRERDFGVWRLWRELSARYPAFEFDHCNGLGVLGVGSEQPAMLQALFGLSQAPDAAGGLRRRLAARGEAFERQVEIVELRQRLQDAAREAQTAIRAAQDAAREAQDERAAGSVAGDAYANELAWRKALLDSQREVIQSKDAAMAALDNLVGARSEALAVRDRMVGQRDATLAELMQQLRRQEHLAREERRAREEMQANHDEMRIGYENAIDQINANRETLNTELIRQQIAARFAGSTSWRLTRPLRVATRLLRGDAAQAPLALPAPASPTQASPTQATPLETSAPADVLATAMPGKRALRESLQARLDAFLAGPEMLRLPSAATPEVSIVLVLYNQAELTFGCLGSIIETLAHAPFGVEIVIVDNASTDQTAALLDRLEGAMIIRNGVNLHFLRAVNIAAGTARGRTLLLLNNDAQLLPGSLAAALRTLDSDARIGAVGGRIILPDGVLQEAGSIIWRDGACSGYGRGQDPNTPDFMFQRDVDYCSGAFLLTPTALFREMGGFDERFAPAYYEETDYCVRLWEGGRRVVYDPDAAIIHYEFGSSTTSADALRLQAVNHAVFVARHEAWLSRQFAASPLNVLAARTARSSAPRMLVIEDRVPKAELGTGYPRANRLLHELVEAGAQVAFFPMFRHAETWHGVRKALDKRIEVLIRAEASQLRDYLVARSRHFDAILVCRPSNMEAFLETVGSEHGLLGGAKVLYDAEALFVTRILQRRAMDGQPVDERERRRMIAEEVSLTRTAGAVISVSAAEQQVLEDYGAQQVHLLGHALDDQPLATRCDERDQMVFLGAIQEDGAPNADALRWFSTEIMPPLRQALGSEAFRLTVIGKNQAPTIAVLDGDTLDLLGMVDELAPALSKARVMVVPTRFAAGIPHKVHQAAMLGIPMVVTGLIAGQLGWRADADLLVADDPAAFAAACARLYKDRALWEKLRRNALARARQDCAPQAFTAKVREIVSGITIVRREADLGTHGNAQPTPPAAPPAPAVEPNTSRPAKADYSVAVPFGYLPLATQPRVGVICHLYYTEVAREVLFYLRNLPLPADLFLSTDTPAKQAELQATFAAWDNGAVEVRVTPNRGRDIAPKLVGFADVYGRYDLVLHLHSKMSAHAAFLEPWRSYLLETLLGSPQIARSVLDAFARLPDLGMVAPQHYGAIRRWLGWNGNFDAAKAIASRMGLTLLRRRALDFPSGSMFWARPAALQPLLDLHLSFDDFPLESKQEDHTPAHAIERLFFYSCERSGHSWLKIAQPALCMDTSTIVELDSPSALSRFVAGHGVALSGPTSIATCDEPAPMMTRVPAGLAARLAKRDL